MLGMQLLPHKGTKQKGSKRGGSGIYHVLQSEKERDTSANVGERGNHDSTASHHNLTYPYMDSI